MLLRMGTLFVGALYVVGCGQQTPTSDVKIIGGEEVSSSQRDLRSRATVALTTELARSEDEDGLLDQGHSFCTGTVIGERVIMTAAHCVQKFDPETQETLDELMFENEEDFIIYFGNEVARNGTWIRAEQVIPHPEWSIEQSLNPSPTEPANDIAVIVLESDIPAEAQVAKIADEQESLADLDAYLVGFGVTTSREENDTGIKRQVTVPVTAEEDQIARFSVGQLFQGVCAGDSGGPAYFEIDGQLQVAGVTSTGAELFGFCLGLISNFTDARTYQSWINNEVGAYM